MSIGTWIYLWAFYSAPLIYISVFVPIPYCLDDCGFVVEPEVRQVDSSNIQNRLLDSVGEGEGGIFRENSIETSIVSRVKQIISPGWLHETDAQG